MAIQIGDKIPETLGLNQDGKEIKAKDFLGKKIVLYFYPRDNTPGCTQQACNLNDNISKLNESNFVVFGISNDSQKSHQNFIKKYNLNFDLIADEDKTLVNLFGVYGLKKFMGKEYYGINRTTFIVDENGVIENIISKVKVKEHFNQIVE